MAARLAAARAHRNSADYHPVTPTDVSARTATPVPPFGPRTALAPCRFPHCSPALQPPLPPEPCPVHPPPPPWRVCVCVWRVARADRQLARRRRRAAAAARREPHAGGDARAAGGGAGAPARRAGGGGGRGRGGCVAPVGGRPAGAVRPGAAPASRPPPGGLYGCLSLYATSALAWQAHPAAACHGLSSLPPAQCVLRLGPPRLRPRMVCWCWTARCTWACGGPPRPPTAGANAWSGPWFATRAADRWALPSRYVRRCDGRHTRSRWLPRPVLLPLHSTCTPHPPGR